MSEKESMKQAKSRNRKGGKDGKNNKNRKKRYFQARCQGIFKEFSRKLVDAVVNNDLTRLVPARQPPEATKMKRFYQYLWGQAGPSSPIVPENAASEFLSHKEFPLITERPAGLRK